MSGCLDLSLVMAALIWTLTGFKAEQVNLAPELTFLNTAPHRPPYGSACSTSSAMPSPNCPQDFSRGSSQAHGKNCCSRGAIAACNALSCRNNWAHFMFTSIVPFLQCFYVVLASVPIAEVKYGPWLGKFPFRRTPMCSLQQTSPSLCRAVLQASH